MARRFALLTMVLLFALSVTMVAQEKGQEKGKPASTAQQPSGNYQPEKVVIKRADLKRGDQVIELDNGQSIVSRAGLGDWWCECTQWHWDCDLGPNGEVWCTKVCVRMDCQRLPAVAPPIQ